MGAVADLFARLTLRPDKKSFDVADKLLGAVKTALIGIVAYKSVSFLGGMVEEVAQTGARLKELSQQTGIGTDSLQELGYAAKLSGADMESLVGGLAKMGMGLDDATKKGEGPMADALRDIGVNISDLKGKMSGAGGFDDILGIVADKFAGMEEGVDKGNAAMAIFGKTGRELIPFLNNGAKGLAELRAAAHEAGVVMDGEAVEGLAGLDDQLDETGLVLKGLKQEIVVGLMPTVKELLSGFLEWVKTNRKMLAQKIASVIRGIAFAFKVLGKAIGVVITVFEFLSNNIGLVISLLGGLGIAMAIYERKAIMAAIKSGLAWAAGALPLILIAALIAAVILIVQDLYVFFDGGDSVFGRFYNSIKHWLGEKVMNVINFFIRGINKVIEAIETLANKAASLMEDHPYLFSLAGGASASGAALAKQTREARRAAGLSADVDFGRIDELKPDESDTDKAVSNYDSPAAAAVRQFNMDVTKMQGMVASLPGSGMVSVPQGGRLSQQQIVDAKVEIKIEGNASEENVRKMKTAITEWWDDVRAQTAVKR